MGKFADSFLGTGDIAVMPDPPQHDKVQKGGAKQGPITSGTGNEGQPQAQKSPTLGHSRTNVK